MASIEFHVMASMALRKFSWLSGPKLATSTGHGPEVLVKSSSAYIAREMWKNYGCGESFALRPSVCMRVSG